MCRRCVEDLSDTGRYSYRNAEPEGLEADYDDRPHGEMQPIIDLMEEGDPAEEAYEAHLDWEAEGGIEPYEPNERCRECGLEIQNYHYNCQGHQNCLPECPACGGGLQEIDYLPEPEDMILGDAASLSQVSEAEQAEIRQQSQAEALEM